jgi:hypothetical protein
MIMRIRIFLWCGGGGPHVAGGCGLWERAVLHLNFHRTPWRARNVGSSCSGQFFLGTVNKTCRIFWGLSSFAILVLFVLLFGR